MKRVEKFEFRLIFIWFSCVKEKNLFHAKRKKNILQTLYRSNAIPATKTFQTNSFWFLMKIGMKMVWKRQTITNKKNKKQATLQRRKKKLKAQNKCLITVETISWILLKNYCGFCCLKNIFNYNKQSLTACF